MRLSELLRQYLPQYPFTVENEQEFETLGLVVSPVECPFCTFVDTERAIDSLGERITMVLTTAALAKQLVRDGRGVCIVDEPRVVFFRLHNALSQHQPYARPVFPTRIGENCRIHPSAVIAENNVVIGDNVVIEEFVVIRENVTVGEGCILRAGVKVGFSDFEYKYENGVLFAVEHCGGVVLGKEVEILPNSCVNKALYPWDDTVVGDHCKLDELVQVSHGVKIGSETMIVGLSGIGGRTEIGKNAWIGYGSILRNGVHIGDNARVNMGAVVSRDVPDGQAVTGNFAIDHDKFMAKLKEMTE